MSAALPRIRLGEICEVNIGRTPARNRSDFWGEDNPWLSIADMNQGRDLQTTKERITDSAVLECNCKPVDPGTVLLSFKLSIGKVGIARTKLFTNEAIAALPIQDEARLLPSFLFWALQSVDLTLGLDRAAKGLTLNKAKLVDIEIPLPPLAEQRRIAEVLDRAEALRAKRRAALAQLDSLTQSLFLDLFGDPVANPKGWPTSSLAEVCSIAGQYGSGVPAIEFSPTLPRYVRITDIDSEGNLATDRVSPGGSSSDWSDLNLEAGDVLFARSGATVGKTYKYSPADGDCVFAGYLIRFRTIPSKLLPEVLFHFTRSEAYLRWVVARQRVVAQPNINARQYGAELIIPLPPISLQNEFASRVATVEKLKAAQRASLAELDALFAALQHRAFRGDL